MPRYVLVRETASTNSYMARMASMLPSGTVIHTPIQSAGRGQRGNSWEAEPYKNTIFSYLLKQPAIGADKQFYISEAASLAVIDALKGYADGFSIKWPNDIYYQDKKIAGMLIENSLAGAGINHSIIGIGLNVNQKEFLSDAPNPISLVQIIGSEVETEKVLHDVCQNIENRTRFAEMNDADFDSMHAEYIDNLYRTDGKFYEFALPSGEKFKARIKDVAPDGVLSLEKEDGTEGNFYFKEVSYII